MKTLKDIIHNQKIIVCCGSGGVGKTTTSAALAIRAALEGRRTIVLTIDPAKRLATSLGLKNIGSTAVNITSTIQKALPTQTLKAELFAIMPDTTQTFEDFIRQTANNNENLIHRVYKNSIYKIFAKEFSGTNEYMAMAKMYQLYSENKYDLIILDTPPSPNTKAFLEAPKLLENFFDESLIRWFVSPSSKILTQAIKKVLEVLERLTGQGFITELLDFTSALFEMRTQFIHNVQAIDQLFYQPFVSFLMVTTAERLSKNHTQEFVELLHTRNYPFWGFILNRVLSTRLQINPSTNMSSPPAASLDEQKILQECFYKVQPFLTYEQNACAFLDQLTTATHNVAKFPELSAELGALESLVELSQSF